MEPESMRDAALRLAREGVAVFPVGADKAPLVPGGFHSASTDAKTLKFWGGLWDVPGVMIGCQPAADQVVIDVDPRNGGDNTLALFPALPRTRTTKTRSDGRHYWLTVEPGTEMRGKLGPGIDVKRHGKGYVVIPPSAGYSYVVTGRMAKAPKWLLDELVVERTFQPGEAAAPRYFPFQTGTPYGEAALRNGLAELRGAGDGGRHETLNKVAFALGMLSAGGELNGDKTCEAILDVAVDIGLDEADAVDVLRRGWFAGMKQPRSAPR
jgi:hypothetical protein